MYPDLAVRDENGRIDGVRYDELAPMLLNEVQKEQRANAAQNERTLGLEATAAAQSAKIAALEQQLAGIQAALGALRPKDELVAQQ